MNFTWIQTCPACPEQYDIYAEKGPAIAYFRLRFGELEVNPYLNGKVDRSTTIYRRVFSDDWKGSLQADELNRLKQEIEQAITLYLSH